MQPLSPPRTPSPLISSVADQAEDDISLPSAEGDNEITRAAGSDPRTLVPEDDKNEEDCTSKDGIKCHTVAIEQQSDLQTKSDPVEEPKPVWTKNRKRAFSYFLLMHFAPVATTLALFWLYLQGFQWRASDVQLKALLFAAKLRKPKSFSSHVIFLSQLPVSCVFEISRVYRFSLLRTSR